MAEYLIKSSACLALFLLFYSLFMEREKMHTIKRVYLLGAIIMALGIPLMTITQYVDVSPEMLRATEGVEMQFLYFDSSPEVANTNIVTLLWILYGMGVLVTGSKFMANLVGIVRRIRRNPKSRQQNLIRVLVQEPIMPHTFFNYIFLNIRQFLTLGIPKEVWLHEVTHARQKHSMDVLFLELLQVIFWFNPLIYMYNRYIKSNHEFLADEGVLKQTVDPVRYQHTLLYYSVSGNQQQLANAFNYSSIKKRITIMKRHTSKTSIRLRTVLILPLLAGALYSFSDKVVVPRISDAEPIINPFPVQDKATPEMVAEYNALAKKYNEMSPNNFHVNREEEERLEYIYGLMTVVQKNNAEPFPEIPGPPPPPRLFRGEDSDIPPPPPAEVVIGAHPSVHGALAAAAVTSAEPALAAIPHLPDSPPSPPIPPEPKSPLDHVIEMAKKGALFYYEGKEITSDKAIEILKKNKNLNINLNVKGERPKVKLSKEPI